MVSGRACGDGNSAAVELVPLFDGLHSDRAIGFHAGDAIDHRQATAGGSRPGHRRGYYLVTSWIVDDVDVSTRFVAQAAAAKVAASNSADSPHRGRYGSAELRVYSALGCSLPRRCLGGFAPDYPSRRGSARRQYAVENSRTVADASVSTTRTAMSGHRIVTI